MLDGANIALLMIIEIIETSEYWIDIAVATITHVEHIKLVSISDYQVQTEFIWSCLWILLQTSLEDLGAAT